MKELELCGRMHKPSDRVIENAYEALRTADGITRQIQDIVSSGAIAHEDMYETRSIVLMSANLRWRLRGTPLPVFIHGIPDEITKHEADYKVVYRQYQNGLLPRTIQMGKTFFKMKPFGKYSISIYYNPYRDYGHIVIISEN